jgi:hypothetical protein
MTEPGYLFLWTVGFGLAPRQLNMTERLNTWNRREMEGDPLIYIVTMLVFFSAGIATLMIIYMKKVGLHFLDIFSPVGMEVHI